MVITAMKDVLQDYLLFTINVTLVLILVLNLVLVLILILMHICQLHIKTSRTQ